MNVLLVIEGTYPWYRGGVSEWIYQYIRNCSNFKFDIVQIATDEFFGLNPENALYPLPENINRFIRIPPPEMEIDWVEASGKWWASVKSEYQKLTSDYDIVHVTNTGFAGWLGIKLSQSLNLPLVLTEHAIYWLEVQKGAVALECGYKIPDHEDGKEQVVRTFKEIARDVYEQSSQVITVSECNIELQEQLGGKNIKYIPNGIPRSWLNYNKVSGEEMVLGWVGRCAEMKNPLQFFEFVRLANELGINAKFLMLLSDANEKELEKQVKKMAKGFPSVTLVWNQPSKEYYHLMDFLFITSHNESQPLVMFEALSKKVLPVGRIVGDLTERYGLVFGSDTTDEEILQAVMKLWLNKTEYSSYLNTRFKTVEEAHTWENIFAIYEHLFREISNTNLVVN
ncbi:MAG: DUF3492 domain-containing protein [Balneolaceae bacterium]